MNILPCPALAVWLTPILMLAGCAMPRSETDLGAETAPEGLTVLDQSALEETHRPVSFRRQIKPILESKCYTCHSSASGEDTKPALQAFVMTRESCAGLIVPGNPGQSRFLALASTHHNLATMPPVGNRLTGTESRLLKRWILEGAPWPQGEAGRLHVSTAEMRPE